MGKKARPGCSGFAPTWNATFATGLMSLGEKYLNFILTISRKDIVDLKSMKAFRYSKSTIQERTGNSWEGLFWDR